jgi:hypothetical protein
MPDGRPLPYVVLWLWLSAVLHYSWMVISLTALHWKEGWTKRPPEPTDSRKGVKCWDWYSGLFTSVYTGHSREGVKFCDWYSGLFRSVYTDHSREGVKCCDWYSGLFRSVYTDQSREGVKCCDWYSGLFRSVYTDHSREGVKDKLQWFSQFQIKLYRDVIVAICPACFIKPFNQYLTNHLVS